MNPVIHFEMPYKDAERAVNFYSTVFGWKMQMLGPDMGNYVLCITAESDVNPTGHTGTINGGLFPYNPEWPAQYPNIVISVDDVHEAARHINAAGGQVLGEPMNIPGVGEYVSFMDTEGNRQAILQPMMG